MILVGISTNRMLVGVFVGILTCLACRNLVEISIVFLIIFNWKILSNIYRKIVVNFKNKNLKHLPKFTYEKIIFYDRFPTNKTVEN